jgi:hypothetical protein
MGAGFAPPSRETFDQKHVGTASKNALMWLTKQQKPDGGIGDPAATSSLEDHALAALALSEVFGLTALEALKEPAQRSVDYLLAHRIPEKGWGANPKATEPDLTATGWALFAVRSAWLAQMKVPSEKLNGEFKTIHETTPFGPALVAVGDNPAFRKDLPAILQKIASEEVPEDAKARDALKILLSEVILHRGDPDGPWKAWKDSARTRLIKSQRYDGNGDTCIAGSWDPAGTAEAGRGRVATTCFTLLALEMEYGMKYHFCAAPTSEK